jgi:polysaccharide export outer membrane protein
MKLVANLRIGCSAVLALWLAGCSSLPSDGPSAMAISSEKVETSLPIDSYLIVQLDEPVVRTVGPWRPHTFADRFAIRSGPRGQPLGIGDTLDIRILEAGDNGLFANTQTRGTQFQVQIDETGNIFVPYVGRMRAAGRSSEALRQAIQEALADKAIQPQVMLGVTGNQANAAVVVGDVAKPGKYPLNVGGTRLLDMVALAGGSRFTTYETTVTLKRKAESASILLEDLVLVPNNNVYLVPDDEILLTFAPQTYTILGSVARPSEIKFETKTVTLAEAVARGGGLNTLAADASGIFVFRFEEPHLVKAIRPDWQPKSAGKIPVVYRLNLLEPKGLFLARQMWLRDKDIVYVATAPAVEFAKFLDIVGKTTAAVRGGTGLARDLQVLNKN